IFIRIYRFRIPGYVKSSARQWWALAFYLLAENISDNSSRGLTMHNHQHNYDLCLQAINERVKSECLLLLPQEHKAVKAIQAEPYGALTTATLSIISGALTPTLLLRLKDNIDDWLNEELSYLDCEWDNHYAKSQKDRLFRQLSGNR
ncbi:hypothetical protein ACS86U_005489, partial [Escherichia coli]